MNIAPASNIDWRMWIRRWDKMQDFYIPARKKRFEIIVQLLASARPKAAKVLDVGCGTGSLMLQVLDTFPDAEVWGIDYDPALFILAEKRLLKFDGRAKLIRADLRKNNWIDIAGRNFDAVVSATALHWLSPSQLSRLYKQFGYILRTGGIFLNADHAGSGCPQIQKEWENQSAKKKHKKKNTDDWDGFWKAYGRALNINVKEYRNKLMGPWVGSENGLPLQWHFEKLRQARFEAIDCFWRLDYDAVYGGIRK